MVLLELHRSLFSDQNIYQKIYNTYWVSDFILCAIALLQVEKTRHYLLLREKLESTLLLGQEVPLSCVCEDLTESSSPSKHLGQGNDPDADPGHEITNERQRKLAAKVKNL